MKEMTKQYVLQTLRYEYLWKVGESDTFCFMLSSIWKFTMTKEKDGYRLYGQKLGTNETHERCYEHMEDIFLHIINRLNENANIINGYDNIQEWLSER